MPSRQVIARELADIFKVIGHPDRIRLIEELRDRECDVNSIASALDLPNARVSQHLALLKAHRLVEERREGRHHFYHLTQPQIAQWIVEGIAFVEGRADQVSIKTIETAKALWSGSQSDAEPSVG